MYKGKRRRERREREKKKRELDYSRTGYYNNESNVQNKRGGAINNNYSYSQLTSKVYVTLARPAGFVMLAVYTPRSDAITFDNVNVLPTEIFTPSLYHCTSPVARGRR